MQRAARWFLWIGLAMLLLGIGACGVSCVAGVAALGDAMSGANGEGTAETAGAIAALGILGVGAGIVSVIVGAILKAFAPSSSEET